VNDDFKNWLILQQLFHIRGCQDKGSEHSW